MILIVYPTAHDGSTCALAWGRAGMTRPAGTTVAHSASRRAAHLAAPSRRATPDTGQSDPIPVLVRPTEVHGHIKLLGV
jgi:hypothetical protein